MTKEELKYYNNINVRMHNAERIVREMWEALYGHGYEITNHHLNGELEHLDTWFEDYDWNLGENENHF